MRLIRPGTWLHPFNTTNFTIWIELSHPVIGITLNEGYIDFSTGIMWQHIPRDGYIGGGIILLGFGIRIGVNRK